MSSWIRWSLSSRIVSLLSAILFSSCISVADLSQSALKYNEAVEEAQNRMLLLNVVRAKRFRPMYITDLTKVSGSIKLDINSGGVETDYGPYITTLLKGKGGLTSGKLTPSVDYVQNPTFDVNVLSAQEFMKGFTSPCTKDLLAYYWEQGWPPEFLLYLFVHDVDDKDGKHYENYPDPSDHELRKLEKFGQWVTKFVKTNPRFVRNDVKIGPCLNQAQVNDLSALVKATKEGLALSKDAGAGPRAGDSGGGDQDAAWQLKQQKPDLILMGETEAKKYEEQKKNGLCGFSVNDESMPVLHLRSPEGMLFYLGELMRVEQKFNKFPAVCIGNRMWPLFVAFDRHTEKRELTCEAAAVAVKYEGAEFIIPDREQEKDDIATSDICSGLDVRPASDVSPPSQAGTKRVQQKVIEGKDLNCFGGMSTECFSLLTQLIALQKSSKDAPTTSLVRAIVQ